MKQIRKNVFETNSSSTHSICISKAPATIGKHISFHTGRYGWKYGCVDTPSYLYTAILCQEEKDELLSKLKNILDSLMMIIILIMTMKRENSFMPY